MAWVHIAIGAAVFVTIAALISVSWRPHHR
jgi:hypothetical protein